MSKTTEPLPSCFKGVVVLSHSTLRCKYIKCGWNTAERMQDNTEYSTYPI